MTTSATSAATAPSGGKGTIPCITIRQPWVDAIFKLGKDVENRSWPTRIRGRIAIHAAAKIERAEAVRLGLDPKTLPTGCIVGTIEIVDCVRNSRSRWAMPGRWHWLLKNPVPLARPIPYTGRLGIFRVKLNA